MSTMYRIRNITSNILIDIKEMEKELQQKKYRLLELQEDCGSTYEHDYVNGICNICNKLLNE